MSPVRPVYALLLGATASCATIAGNDAALTPVVRNAPSGSSVIAGPGRQVAAFLVVHRVDGWSLQFLGASDSAGALTSSAPPVPSNEPVLVPVRTAGAFVADVCDSWSPTTDANGQVTLTLSTTCTTRDLAQLQPDSILEYFPRVPTPWRTVTDVILVSTTSPLTARRWNAVADSLGTVSVLLQVPAKLGALAFQGNSSAHWSALRQTVWGYGPTMRWVR